MCLKFKKKRTNKLKHNTCLDAPFNDFTQIPNLKFTENVVLSL